MTRTKKTITLLLLFIKYTRIKNKLKLRNKRACILVIKKTCEYGWHCLLIVTWQQSTSKNFFVNS